MRRLQCVSGPTWGPSLLKMRHLYLTKIRPIITYGCAVWFLRGSDVKWNLTDTLMRKLESIQYQCLMRVAGAFKGTPRQYLLQELYIEPLEVHRAKAINVCAQDAAKTMVSE